MNTRYLPTQMLFGVACLLGVVSARADYTDNLLVGWTFNNGTLTSDLGTLSGGSAITFSEGGTGINMTTTFNSADGSVSLGAGRMLYTSDINSTAYPELGNALTIWVRVRTDSLATDAVLFGLVDATTPTSGTNARTATMSVASASGGNGTVRFQGRTSEPSVVGRGSGFSTISTGEFYELAIRVSDLGTLSSTYSDWVSMNGESGTTLSGTWNGRDHDLQSFASFALGRLNSNATAALTFDEVRIYSAYLTDAQLALITPSIIPEPASAAWLLGFAGLAGATLRRRRRA